MKKQFTINFDIDTDANGESMSSLDHYPDLNSYVVKIRKDHDVPSKANAPFPKLLHEIGHVLGHVFESPAHKKIDAYNQTVLAAVLGNTSEQLIPVEKEAWNFAQQQFDESKKYALASYQKAGQ